VGTVELVVVKMPLKTEELTYEAEALGLEAAEPVGVELLEVVPVGSIPLKRLLELL
jgi:hypothetical protein